MGEVFIGLGLFAALVVVCMIYGHFKQKAKRKIFKGKYEEQKSLTHNATIVQTASTIAQVKQSLKETIPTDDSAKAAFLGGRLKIQSETDNYIEYYHTSHFKVSGEGDEFTGSVAFEPTETGLTVTIRIEKWREKDGITQKAGIEAMRKFVELAKTAVLNTDPNAKVSQQAQQAIY